MLKGWLLPALGGGGALNSCLGLFSHVGEVLGDTRPSSKNKEYGQDCMHEHMNRIMEIRTSGYRAGEMV